jgi:hypothetical protein
MLSVGSQGLEKTPNQNHAVIVTTKGERVQ